MDEYNINLNCLYALNKLMNLCIAEGIEIEQVWYYLNGFVVLFKGFDGDACCHGGSYGRGKGMWETLGMPWDNDVSSHDAETLVKMLKALRDNKDWTIYDS